ncbi:hypothetical protein Tco_0201770 [Tanacetum coccineum]
MYQPIVTAPVTFHQLIMQWILLLAAFQYLDVYGESSTSQALFQPSGFCDSQLQSQPSNSNMVPHLHTHSDVFQNYYELCEWCARPQCVTALRGTAFDVQRSDPDSAKRKVATNEDYDLFEAYSQLCARNVRAWCSADLAQTKQIIDSDAFKKYMELCARSVIPRQRQQHLCSHSMLIFFRFPSCLSPDSNRANTSVLNQRKRTRPTTEIRRPSDEIDTSKRIHTPVASTRSILVRCPSRLPPRVARVDTEGSSSGHARAMTALWGCILVWGTPKRAFSQWKARLSSMLWRSLAILAPMGHGPPPVRFGRMWSKPLPSDPYKKISASKYSKFKANSEISLSDLGILVFKSGSISSSGATSGMRKKRTRRRNTMVIIGPTVVEEDDGAIWLILSYCKYVSGLIFIGVGSTRSELVTLLYSETTSPFQESDLQMETRIADELYSHIGEPKAELGQTSNAHVKEPRSLVSINAPPV